MRKYGKIYKMRNEELCKIVRVRERKRQKEREKETVKERRVEEGYEGEGLTDLPEEKRDFRESTLRQMATRFLINYTEMMERRVRESVCVCVCAIVEVRGRG